MKNILIYLNDSTNLIYLISLSILIAIMIIISKKNEFKFTIAYTKNIQKYLNLNIARNYLIGLKFKKIKLTSKYHWLHIFKSLDDALSWIFNMSNGITHFYFTCYFNPRNNVTHISSRNYICTSP